MSILSNPSPLQFQIDLVNKIMLHSCSMYYLGRETANSNEKDEQGNVIKKVVRYCKHHFGD